MISLVNEFSVLLDTCTIVPISLCDLLLRLAESPSMYLPRWSPEILEELVRTLERPPFSLASEKAAYRIACMESAFPEALITGYESLTESMPNHSKDRHVLAAAVCGRVESVSRTGSGTGCNATSAPSAVRNFKRRATLAG
jgi:hypothetical protein